MIVVLAPEHQCRYSCFPSPPSRIDDESGDGSDQEEYKFKSL